ncbi:MAG: O-antigen ligase family protein [Candidatus Aureabacteria bacterium]|nr:O-antigen ligase family protein [Candidatus Auribacterota bacterium]
MGQLWSTLKYIPSPLEGGGCTHSARHYERAWIALCLAFGCVLLARILWCGVMAPESNFFLLLPLSLILAAALILCALSPGDPWRMATADWYVAGFFVIICLHAVVKGRTWLSADFVAQMAGCTAAYFCARRFAEREAVRSVLWIALFGGVFIVSLYAIYQSVWGLEGTRALLGDLAKQGDRNSPFLSRVFSSAVSSTFFFPNAFAGYLIVMIPLIASIFFWRERDLFDAAAGTYLAVIPAALIAGGLFADLAAKPLLIASLCAAVVALVAGLKLAAGRNRRVMCLLCAPLLLAPVYALWLTSSEGAYLALVASALVIVLTIGGRQRLAALIVLIAFLMGWAAFRAAAIPQGMLDSAGARGDYWSAAARMWRDNPLAGIGIGGFPGAYPLYRGPLAEEGRLAHSAYFSLAAESGVFGLVAFLVMWGVLLASIMRGARCGGAFPTAVCVAIGAFLLHSAVDVDLHVPGITFTIWVLAGMGVTMAAGDHRQRVLTRTACVLASTAVLCAIGAWVEPRALAERYRLEAERCEREGAGGEAAAAIQNAVSLQPGNAVYMSAHAGILERGGKGDRSLAMYERIAGMAEGMPGYQFQLAAAYWRASREGMDRPRARQALAALDRAIACNPYDVDYLMLRGSWHEKTGNIPEAINGFEQSRDLIATLERAPRRIRRHTTAEYGTLMSMVEQRIKELKNR